MNKKYFVMAVYTLCALLPSDVLSFAKSGNKHLVKSHMDELNAALTKLEQSGKGITYEERMRIQSNLRRKFAHRKMRPYKTKNEEEIVRLIGRSYEEIKNTPGNHPRALEHYKEEAAGRIALYAKPSKMHKAKTGESRGTQPSLITRAGDALGTLKRSPSGVGGPVKTTQTAPTGSIPKAHDVTPFKKKTAKPIGVTKAKGKKKTFEERMEKKEKKKAKKKAQKRKSEPKTPAQKRAKKARKLAKKQGRLPAKKTRPVTVR